MSAGAINQGRTFAVFITPVANGSIPACGTPQWAGSCRKTNVISCSSPIFSPSTLVSASQTICRAGDPEVIDMSDPGSDITGYQWYFRSGLIAAPGNTAALTGWNIISGATAASYDPPSGLTASRTYACRVSNASNSQWANGVRQVTVLPAFSPGSLIANQNGCRGYDPAPVTMASIPTGSGSYSYQWYYWENATIACPSGSIVPSGGVTSFADPRFFGTTNTGAGINFDASSAGSNGRTWAVLITPGSNGSVPACGVPQFATTCHRTNIVACRIAADGMDDESSIGGTDVQLGQNIPNPWIGETRIPYFLPEGTRNAILKVMNTEGKTVYQENINQTGNGEVILKEGQLPSGLFLYQIVADNEVSTRPLKLVVMK
jgi:hypothetical protein